jgi:hypothetical protein
MTSELDLYRAVEMARHDVEFGFTLRQSAETAADRFAVDAGQVEELAGEAIKACATHRAELKPTGRPRKTRPPHQDVDLGFDCGSLDDLELMTLGDSDFLSDAELFPALSGDQVQNLGVPPMTAAPATTPGKRRRVKGG